MIYKSYMERMRGFDDFNLTYYQMEAYENYLKDKTNSKGNPALKEQTIENKIKHLTDYIYHLKSNEIDYGKENFDFKSSIKKYVKDGLFKEDNEENLGGSKYRKDIFYNIATGINFLNENDSRYSQVDLLDNEEKVEMDKVDNPKVIKEISTRVCLSDIQNIEGKILEDIGIELHINENGKGYVYSHELSDVLEIKSKHINEKLKKKYSNYKEDMENIDGGRKIDHLSTLDFSMEEDYRDETNENGIVQKSKTYRIGKDLLFSYLLSLSSNKKVNIRMVQYKYQLGFNLMKEMIIELLKERIELKNHLGEFMNKSRIITRDALKEKNYTDKKIKNYENLLNENNIKF